MAEAVGARSLTLVEFYGARPPLEVAVEAFAEACDVAAEHGVLVHLEFLPWAGIADLATAWDIVRGADRPNGGLLVDSWHFFRSASTLEELSTVPGDRVLYVQLSDGPATAESDLAEETQHRRLMPGDGAMDLGAFLRVLDAVGCAAPVGAEVFSDQLNTRPVDEVARHVAHATRATIAEARAGAVVAP
jgi:sugar phosphate isomerase/epimerase